MRARSVLREMPSRAAVREMFQLVCASTSSRCSRMASLSETGAVAVRAAAGGGAATGAWAAGRPSPSAVISLAADMSTARSSTFDSSRTLPGQRWATSAAHASADSVLRGTP